MTVLLDILPLIASLIVGIITQLFKMKMAFNYQQRQMELAVMKQTESSIQAARQYETPHTSKMRKFLVLVICLPFLFPALLGLLNWAGGIIAMLNHTPWVIDPLCIHVPEIIKHGGLLSLIWTMEQTQYIQICGFVMFPIYVYAFQVILGFHFGQASTKLTFGQ